MLKKLTLSLSFLMVLTSLIAAGLGVAGTAEAATTASEPMMTSNSVSWWWQ